MDEIKDINICNTYGGLRVKSSNGKFYWSIEDYSGDHWGCVYAIDVFPELKNNVDSSGVLMDADTFFRCAAGAVGFRGVGYYPQWEMGTLKGGFHLDVRPDRTMDDPAEWGYVNGEFVSADEALEWGK